MQIIKSSQSFLDKFLIDKNLSVSFQFSIRCISDASSLCLRGYLNTLTLSPPLCQIPSDDIKALNESGIHLTDTAAITPV